MKLLFQMVLVALAAGCVVGPEVSGLPVKRPEELSPSMGFIAIVGDLQMTPLPVRKIMRRENNAAQQRILVDDLVSRVEDLAALVVVGDLVFTPTSRSDWRHFDNIVGPIAAQVPVLPAIGNHDYRCYLVRWCTHKSVPKNFLSRFDWFAPGKPYFVAYGNLVLVFLDSEIGISEQGDWLRARLPEFERKFLAIAVFTHRPPYTDADVADVEPNEALQENIVAALDQSQLPSVFFSGHAHGYEHLFVDGRHYIVSAGGGGPRGKLAADRPFDVYAGTDCPDDADDVVLRPYNYQLLSFDGRDLKVETYGFCRSDTSVARLESFSVRVSRR